MDTIESDIDQLERYLKSLCTESEKQEVEKRLASDPDFRDWEGSSGNLHEFDWQG